MRILILVHGYPPTYAGGAELRAARTVRSLAARGHCVRVLCVESMDAPAGHPPFEDQDEDGARVRRLFLTPGPEEPSLDWEYDNPITARALGELIAAWRPDVIHVFSGYLMTGSVIWQAGKQGVPIVVSLTDFWWLCHRINLMRTDGCRCDGPTPEGCARCHSELYRHFRLPAQVWRGASDAFWRRSSHTPVLRSLLKMPHYEERLRTNVAALNRADALIAPSRYLADVYRCYGVEPAKIRTWRQGVDVDRCLLRTASPTLRVGYLGQVKYHKGVDLLVDAWSVLRGPSPRTLVIYGSDEGEAAYGQRLRQRLAGLRNVTWAAPIQRADIWSALANLDVVVVPSRWVENSPNVILEAQAVGVVVVGTNLGGVAELVRHEENGLLFEPDSVTALAVQLQRLIDEPDLVAQLRRYPIPFQSHTAEIDRIESLYESLAQPVRRLPISTTPAG
jgi:glycosyltransferase involved in cell wall biosynthesis